MNNIKYETLIGAYLRSGCLSLSVAESCTGGLISHKITNIPGSSDYYLGGVVTYTNEAKEQLLGVDQQTLEFHSAVSAETVGEMAAGVRQKFRADIGIAVSGFAGPGGGTPEKPVGTIWIGLSDQENQHTWCYQLDGTRIQVKEQSADLALKHLYEYLIIR